MSEDELREKIERAVLTEIQQPIYDASEIESSDPSCGFGLKKFPFFRMGGIMGSTLLLKVDRDQLVKLLEADKAVAENVYQEQLKEYDRKLDKYVELVKKRKRVRMPRQPSDFTVIHLGSMIEMLKLSKESTLELSFREYTAIRWRENPEAMASLGLANYLTSDTMAMRGELERKTSGIASRDEEDEIEV